MAPLTPSDPSALTPTVAVRLSGSGGQGLILAGRLLAEAASLYDGLDIVQTNSYGPEARGGASRSEVVVGRGEIDLLHSHVVDALVCLTQASCDAYYRDLRPGGLLITDSETVHVVPTSRVVEVPMSALARQAGNVMATNVVALAVLVAVSQIVSRGSLEAAVRQRVPSAHREVNSRAIEAGFAAAETALAGKSPKMRAQYPDFAFLRQSLTGLSTTVQIPPTLGETPC